MFGGHFVVGWMAVLVAVGYVQSALPLTQLGRASSKGRFGFGMMMIILSIMQFKGYTLQS